MLSMTHVQAITTCRPDDAYTCIQELHQHWSKQQGALSADLGQYERNISDQGAVSIRKTVLPGMAIPMLKIRRPNGRLIFNMENAIRR